MSMFIACSSKKQTLFSKLSPGATGISFQNKINPADTFNILDYLYFYNGGGVAIGDVNNDGLEDIFFTSNQEANQLYLNKGAFQFENISKDAKIEGKGNWKTGVTMADINSDGWLDIYVCEVGQYKSLHGRNELYINNGPSKSGRVSFTESAKEYGLDAEGFNTQASFFDYDKDGDLDLFLVNHSVHSVDTYVDASERNKRSDVSGDKLYRCERNNGKIFYNEVTEEAGIYSSALGYGLNVITADFNNDNWDDIYVSNDFHENDYYYINNQNGTFSEKSATAFGHQSRFSMGSDAGDVNGDGWQDLITLDMLPEDEKVLKSSVSDDPLDVYEFKMSKGYHHQYSKNCLQLNSGGGKKFSDISLYAGVAATDWSWSPLLADLNNDGIKDLFISNGVVKRPNDLDFLKFISSPSINSALQSGKSADHLAIDRMPEGKVANYFFEGSRELKFADRSKEYGFDEPSFSTGAAYADLDNDGDLDVVTNNINEPAGIYKNNLREFSKTHYLQVELKSSTPNTKNYGAKISIKNGGVLQTNFITASRGFQSASSTIVHFGTGQYDRIDTLQVVWPDGSFQTITNVPANQRLMIRQQKATQPSKALLPDSTTLIQDFVNYTDSIPFDYRHVENNFNDFNTQPFIPHKTSTEGPKLAVGDANGDGLDDLFVCNAKGSASKLFIQQKNGSFQSSNEPVFEQDADSEDVNAVFFDADGDGDNDLYVVTGGDEVENDLHDRLYLNDGKGNFSKTVFSNAPIGNKSVVRPADFDRDGDQDLFVGGRTVVGNYGLTPESYLLINDGRGNFKAADQKAHYLKQVGMVTDAVWTDLERDGWQDLVIVGEWMPIAVYKNEKGVLRNATADFGLNGTSGLWTTITASDLNGDGYPELLAGNRGENSKLKASAQFPLQLYLGDIDGNGALDQVMALAKNNRYYPFLGKEEIEKVLPAFIRKKYLDYKSMAGEAVEVLLKDQMSVLKKLSAATLSSAIITNQKGKLSFEPLPSNVQWSPVFCFLVDDLNNDQQSDILAAGNFHGVLPYEGRYDASYGNVLINHGGQFQSLSNLQSGLMLDGEIRDAKAIRLANGKKMYVFARNNDKLLFYKRR